LNFSATIDKTFVVSLLIIYVLFVLRSQLKVIGIHIIIMQTLNKVRIKFLFNMALKDRQNWFTLWLSIELCSITQDRRAKLDTW